MTTHDWPEGHAEFVAYCDANPEFKNHTPFGWFLAGLAANRLLLKEAHDLLDDENAGENAHYRDGKLPKCIWCETVGYDGTGMKHSEDCILVRIRATGATA